MHLLGVLGTQETSCFVVAGLLERDIFDLFLPEFDKPWVIHLRENLLLFYKPMLLEAQHCLQEKEGEVDIRFHPRMEVVFALAYQLPFDEELEVVFPIGQRQVAI